LIRHLESERYVSARAKHLQLFGDLFGTVLEPRLSFHTLAEMQNMDSLQRREVVELSPFLMNRRLEFEYRECDSIELYVRDLCTLKRL
jgi:hypothetical protein